ncbi:MAG: hypothetical protein HON78_04340 [Legionellales bacterium]|jgi:glycine cleavage system transcriptional repressor|nr:hypothetical protein [Legionellales bacterium]
MVSNVPKQQLMQITSICDINDCISLEITELVYKFESSLNSMRQTRDNDRSISLFNVIGSWNNINKIEGALGKISQENTNNVISSTISEIKNTNDAQKYIHYHVNVVATDDVMIIPEIMKFCELNDIIIDHINLDNYINSERQIPLLVINAKVAIEHKLSLSDIREQFIILCDNLNVDGILDPIRPY